MEVNPLKNRINTIDIETFFCPFNCDVLFNELLSNFKNKDLNLTTEINNFKNSYEIADKELLEITKISNFNKHLKTDSSKNEYHYNYIQTIPFIYNFDVNKTQLQEYISRTNIYPNTTTNLSEIDISYIDMSLNDYTDMDNNKQKKLLDFFIVYFLLFQEIYYHFFENLINQKYLFILPVYINGTEVQNLENYFKSNDFSDLKKNNDKIGKSYDISNCYNNNNSNNCEFSNGNISFYNKLSIMFYYYLMGKYNSPNNFPEPFKLNDSDRGLNNVEIFQLLNKCKNIFFFKSLYRNTETTIKTKEEYKKVFDREISKLVIKMQDAYKNYNEFTKMIYFSNKDDGISLNYYNKTYIKTNKFLSELFNEFLLDNTKKEEGIQTKRKTINEVQYIPLILKEPNFLQININYSIENDIIKNNIKIADNKNELTSYFLNNVQFLIQYVLFIYNIKVLNERKKTILDEGTTAEQFDKLNILFKKNYVNNDPYIVKDIKAARFNLYVIETASGVYLKGYFTNIEKNIYLFKITNIKHKNNDNYYYSDGTDVGVSGEFLYTDEKINDDYKKKLFGQTKTKKNQKEYNLEIIMTNAGKSNDDIQRIKDLAEARDIILKESYFDEYVKSVSIYIKSSESEKKNKKEKKGMGILQKFIPKEKYKILTHNLFDNQFNVKKVFYYLKDFLITKKNLVLFLNSKSNEKKSEKEYETLNVELIKILSNANLLDEFYNFNYDNYNLRSKYILDDKKNNVIKSILNILFQLHSPFYIKQGIRSQTTTSSASFRINNYSIVKDGIIDPSSNDTRTNPQNNEESIQKTITENIKIAKNIQKDNSSSISKEEYDETNEILKKEEEEIQKILKNQNTKVIIEVDLIHKDDMFDFTKTDCKSINKRLTKKFKSIFGNVSKSSTLKKIKLRNKMLNYNVNN